MRTQDITWLSEVSDDVDAFKVGFKLLLKPTLEFLLLIVSNSVSIRYTRLASDKVHFSIKFDSPVTEDSSTFTDEFWFITITSTGT